MGQDMAIAPINWSMHLRRSARPVRYEQSWVKVRRSRQSGALTRHQDDDTEDDDEVTMPTVSLGDVEIAYDVGGDPDADPVMLICGCGQPAVAWQLGPAPALTAAGYQVVTFDNRGVAPSSSPPAPYTVAELAADALGLLDHLGIAQARLAGYSLGGWVAETLAIRHPDRVRAAAFLGSCNVATAWEKAITTVERDMARLDFALPPLFYATETLRYLPNKALQEDEVVE